MEIDSLTEKERQIVSLVAAGMRCAEIAAALRAAPMTVRKHRVNIARKLGLSGTAQLVAYAVGHTSGPAAGLSPTGARRAWAARAGRVAPDRHRDDQQGNREKTRHQPTHDQQAS